MDTKDKAERYVRVQIPELFYSFCSAHQNTDANCERCKHGSWGEPQLQHWLRVLVPCVHDLRFHGNMYVSVFPEDTDKRTIIINLTTGQPATEADYEAFCGIVGI